MVPQRQARSMTWQIAQPEAIAEKIQNHPRPQGLFHPVNISDINAGTVEHTHVQVSAIVDKMHNEKDGDVHLHISNGDASMVAEIIPELPVEVPPLNQPLTIGGILRYDSQHSWWELHPIT